jgi:hypothetical protein
MAVPTPIGPAGPADANCSTAAMAQSQEMLVSCRRARISPTLGRAQADQVVFRSSTSRRRVAYVQTVRRPDGDAGRMVAARSGNALGTPRMETGAMDTPRAGVSGGVLVLICREG